MPSRLTETLQALRARGEKAMGLFLTNGFPEPAATLPILRTLDESGADFLELGMPFSDPLAEGLPIQRSSARALRHGIRMGDAFRTVERFRASSETPVLLMGYVNPVHRYGISNFFRDARSSGVDGLILADLPAEEAGLVQAEAREAGVDLVFLVAPTTPDERVRRLDELATGFLYAVSVTGLTGSALGDAGGIAGYLARVRRLAAHRPVLVGFGIRSHEDAMRLSEPVDGFIVGSALVELVERLWDDGALSEKERLSRIASFVRQLKYGPVPRPSAVGG